jgi:hypothetical protein
MAERAGRFSAEELTPHWFRYLPQSQAAMIAK